MTYFKSRETESIHKPSIKTVLFWQVLASIAGGLIVWWFSGMAALSFVCGGLISILGQGFYGVRALRFFGTPEALKSVSAAVAAMAGKWLIIIVATLLLLTYIEEFRAGAYFAGLFIIHTTGALLLPLLVKRAT